MLVHDLSTPCLLVDADALAHNLAVMGERWPGRSLRPHVKAFKSTSLAKELRAAGHDAFCAATPAEVVGMAAAGLGADLLLANEVVDVDRLRTMVASTLGSRITVAVDSSETIAAAATAGAREVLIDVAVGLPRCGCAPEAAGALADEARRAGLEVRGLMGYEGHLMMEETDKQGKVEAAMALLARAHADVGGDVVSGGGTGTWDTNRWVTELQAGSFTLMDHDYGRLDSPFRQALTVWTTVISADPGRRWFVVDAGLKAVATDHGVPILASSTASEPTRAWYSSDEHSTFPIEASRPIQVGDKVALVPGHVDPTVALHDRLHLVRGDEVVDTWAVDLRGWDLRSG